MRQKATRLSNSYVKTFEMSFGSMLSPSKKSTICFLEYYSYLARISECRLSCPNIPYVYMRIKLHFSGDQFTHFCSKHYSAYILEQLLMIRSYKYFAYTIEKRKYRNVFCLFVFFFLAETVSKFIFALETP